MSIFSKKAKKAEFSFDPNKQYPVLRCSICTGEQVAGFRDKETKHFTEVMLIKDESDLEAFKQSYNISELVKEY